MHQNQPVTIMTALLFTPFLPLVLALSFGLWVGDRALLRQGALALLCSTAVAVVAGAVVGWGMGDSSRFTDFKPFVVSSVISAGIGWVAGSPRPMMSDGIISLPSPPPRSMPFIRSGPGCR
jgi:hypothetical protein